MDKIQFLRNFSKEQLMDIAEELGFYYIEDGFRKGSSLEVGEDCIIAQSWDNDYSSHADYDGDFIIFNDHEVLKKSMYYDEELTELNALLFNIMKLNFNKPYEKANAEYLEELKREMQAGQNQDQPESM